MTVNKFIKKLLNLKELIVLNFDLNENKRHLLFSLKLIKRLPITNAIIVANIGHSITMTGMNTIHIRDHRNNHSAKRILTSLIYP